MGDNGINYIPLHTIIPLQYINVLTEDSQTTEPPVSFDPGYQFYPYWITMSLCLSICGITMDNLHSQQSLFIQDWHYLTPLTLQHWESNSYNATILKWHWQGLWLGLPHYMTCLGACKALACLMPGRTQTIYILCYRSIQRFLCSLSCKKETQFFQRK